MAAPSQPILDRALALQSAAAFHARAVRCSLCGLEIRDGFCADRCAKGNGGGSMTRLTPFQALARGLRPLERDPQFPHGELVADPLDTPTDDVRDDIELGLWLGNLMASAVYGPRGEHRD